MKGAVMEYKEIGTLSEIGAKVGDVVIMDGDKRKEKFTCIECPPRQGKFRDHWLLDGEMIGGVLFRDDPFRMISRATSAPDLLLTDRARDLNALMALLRDANTAALDLSAYDVSRAIIDAMAKTVPHYMGANE
jgi:hypothetical protein